MTEVNERDQLTLNSATPNLRQGVQPSIVKKLLWIIDATTEFVN